MSKFLRRLLAFACLLSLLFAAATTQTNRFMQNHSMIAAYPDKLQALQEVQSPKIVLVGGSNVAFGFDSNRISEASGRPTINTALHADLGLKFMLDWVQPNIVAGDLVIISPEYEQFTTEFYGGTMLMALTTDIDPTAKMLLSRRQRFFLIPSWFGYTSKKLLPPWNFGSERRANSLYSRSLFNASGDAVGHYGLATRPYTEFAKKSGNITILNDSIVRLKQFVNEVQRRGGSAILLPPVIEQNSFDNIADLILKVERALEIADVPFVATPGQFVVPRSLTFDTPYHLTKEGVELRTSQTIDIIETMTNPPVRVSNGD